MEREKALLGPGRTNRGLVGGGEGWLWPGGPHLGETFLF